MTPVVDDLIFDVGMHRGEDANFYLKKGYRVVGFEANPALITLCKARFSAEIASDRLIIVEGAIAPEDAGETVTFFQNDDVTVWGTTDPVWADRNKQLGCQSRAITVDRVDMVKAYERFGVPHYLKVDIEGADKLVLDGLKRVGGCPRHISIESEKADFTSLEKELAALRDLGFQRFRAVQQQWIPQQSIVARTRDGRAFDYSFEVDSSGPFDDDLPQPWLSFDDVVAEYREIFRRYRLFGDSSLFMKMPKQAQRCFEIMYNWCLGRHTPLCGWFDTHASI